MTHMANDATPARRATKRAPNQATPPDPPPTPAVAPAVEPDRLTATITFAGRDLPVVMPRPEQLAIWQRTLSRLGNADLTAMTGAEVGQLINRSIRIVETVLADPADHEWLEDQLLDGGMSLADAANIVTAALAALGAGGEPNGAVASRPKARPRR